MLQIIAFHCCFSIKAYVAIIGDKYLTKYVLFSFAHNEFLNSYSTNKLILSISVQENYKR